MRDERREELKQLYNGKYYYEIVDGGELGVNIVGPLDNILYKNPVGTGFVQVVNGQIVQEFMENQIIVIDRELSFISMKSGSITGCNDCSCGKKEQIVDIDE